MIKDEHLHLQVTNTRSALYHIHLIESGTQTTGEFQRVVVGPKVHEEQVWRFYQHVAVQGRHFDTVVSQCFDHRVDLTGEQHEVAGDGCLVSTCRLEVNGLSNSHRRWNLHFIVHDLVGAWNGELIDPAIYFSTLAHDLIDLLRINAEFLIWSCSGGRSERRFTQRERIMNRFSDLYGVSHGINVHVHNPWRFMQHCV